MKKRILTYFGMTLLSMLVVSQLFAQVNHPANGSGNVTETLTPGGFVNYYDTGGPGGNYNNNHSWTNNEQTFAPSAPGAKVVAVFNSFNLEANWDAIYVFDGPDRFAPIIPGPNNPIGAPPAGGYWGTTPPGPFLASGAGGELTFTFASDGSGTRFGWEACITETPGCSPIAAPADVLDLANDLNICTATLTTALPSTDCASEPGVNISYSVDGGTAVVINQPFPPTVSIPGLSAGSHTITWTLNFSGSTPCGQIDVELSSDDQEIFVQDTEPPVLSCPSDITINLNPGDCCGFHSYNITATDNCPFEVPAAPYNGIAPAQGGGSTFDMTTFDIVNTGTQPITITSLDQYYFDNTPNVDWRIFNKPGSQAGFATNPGAWTQVGGALIPVSPGNGNSVNLPITSSFVIQPGETWGVAVGFPPPAGFPFLYDFPPVVNPVADANGVLQVNGGATTNLFAGTFLQPRGWIGNINYNVGGGEIPVRQIDNSGFTSGDCFEIGETVQEWEAEDAQGNTSTCSWTVTINEFPNATQSLTCNDNVQVSLDSFCMAVIGADDILEGGPYGCYDNRYTVMVLSPLGANLGNVVDNSFVGDEWTVKVVDDTTGQSCWGSILVEDKLPPVLECIDLTVDCTADLDDPDIRQPAPASPGTLEPGLYVPTNPLQSGAFLWGNFESAIMFDLENTGVQQVSIESFGLAMFNFQTGFVDDTYSVFVTNNSDTRTGNETDPTAWDVLTDMEVISSSLWLFPADPIPTFVPVNSDLILQPGEKVGIHIYDAVGGASNTWNFGGGTWTDGNIEVTNPRAINGFYAGGFADPVNPNLIVNYAFFNEQVDPSDNCELESVDFDEAFVDGACGGPSGVVTRTWKATDASGNESTCVQSITLERPSVSDVELPLNIKWTCVQYDIFPNIIDPVALHEYVTDCDPDNEDLFDATCYDASCDDLDQPIRDRPEINSTVNGLGCPGNGLDDADVLALTGSGYPTVNGDPLISICEIGIEYEDIVVQECEGSFKIVRQWTIIDWCSNPIDIRQENQVIKVVDEEPPVVELFGVDGDIESNYGNTQIPALGNLGNPNTTGGCGQEPQNTGGTVFTALVQLPGTGAQFNPDQFTNISLQSVEITLNHEHVEDLDIFLKGPSNKVIELSTDNGIDGTGYHRTKFRDDATISIVDAASPFTGVFLPEGTDRTSCGGFNGNVATLADMTTNWQADVLGTWELIIFDDDEDNIGEMVSWKINFSFGDVTLDVYNATATSNIHTVCEGSVLVPPVQNCTDNCSGIMAYTTELWTMDAAGDPEYQIGTIAGNGGYFDNVPMFRNGLPARYIVRYCAVDGCKNQACVDMTVRLRDRVPPVVVCDEITEVVITNNGQGTGTSCSRIYADDLDDGSYDNCTPIYFLMAKMDDSFSQDIYNRCYYPHRDFCCDDVGDNTVIVLVLDQDPAPFFNTNIGSPALGCDEPTPDYPSLFLSPNSIGNFTVPGTNQLVPVNYNTCMVTVQVTDKLPPVLVNCPANERISCDLYASNFETQLANAADQEEQCDILSAYFGSAEYFDNCVANVECTVSINLDQCLEGNIRRTWRATDDGGNTNSSQNCNQTIFVDQVSDFVVEFPQNRDDDLINGHLPAVECGDDVPDFGEPEIFYETCELVAVSYEDDIFTDVDSACYKIAREWTVINWCVVGDEIDQEVEEHSERELRNAGCLTSVNLECDLDGDGDCDTRTFRDSWAICNLPDAAHANQNTNPDTDPDSDPWDGFIEYTQIIKVKDSVDPVFTNGCAIPDVCITDNTCSATVLLPTPDVMDCTTNLTFTYEIYIGGQWLNGAGPYFPVAPGQYPVRYRAIDNCNNQSACETVLNVVDCKKPTPYCKNGIVVELMVPVPPSTDPAMVEVWASDLNDNSFDNCPGALKYSFSSDVNDVGITFTCDDLGQNDVEMWVTDAAGNQDFCLTAVIIQANMNQCDDSLSVVGGQLATEFGDGVEDVSVNINSPGGFNADVMTGTNGMYSTAVPPGGDYTITPVHDVDPLNGVTTFDLVVISKHILGVDLLDSPYQVIAADANRSGTVTTFDLVELRKLILFINTDFPNNTSWRFVDGGHVFADPMNPFAVQFPEVVNINNLTGGQLSTDFVAVKVGDVNGSAEVNFAANGTDDRNTVGELVINTDDAVLTEGETYTVEFKATDFAVSGYQFTLNFDMNALGFEGVVPGLADESNFGLAMVEEGIITTSWNSTGVKTLATDDVVFGLTFTAKQSGHLSSLLNINSRYTVAEAYNADAGLLDVALSFNNTAVAGGFELYQNTPNPFASTTNIGFHLPEATSATLTISDVQGKVVKVIEGDFDKGYNQVTLKRSELGATGVMYYRLDTDSDSATRMMILVD